MTTTSPTSAESTGLAARDSHMLDLDDHLPIMFRADVRLETSDEAVRLFSLLGSFALGRVPASITSSLRQLITEPTTLTELSVPLSDWEGLQLRKILLRFNHLLVKHVITYGRELARFEPIARDANYQPADLSVDAAVKLSKFAFFRSRDNVFVVESPLAKHRVALVDPAACALLTTLARPATVRTLAGELPVSAITTLLAHLVGAGFVEITSQVADGDGHCEPQFASDTDPLLRQWDFHDLLFHARSRGGRSDEPFGAVFPYLDEIEPRSALKPVPNGTAIPLYRPSWEDIANNDPSLLTVMEGRASIRKYGEQPLTLRQVGEFLYRVARVKAQYGPDHGMPYEVAARPYPCGGGAYELELYLTVQRCANLAAGIYYYDPVNHHLVLVNDDLVDRSAMLRVAMISTAMQANPDILITMTSRFQRLSWKYRSIAYAVTLRHTGVLYQTMYLVATAMGLAPCGLGSGDSDLAARVLHLDYRVESSVGDFLIGSRPDNWSRESAIPKNWRPRNDASWRQRAKQLLSSEEEL